MLFARARVLPLWQGHLEDARFTVLLLQCAPFFCKFSGKIVAGVLLQWWLLTICLLFFLETVAVLRGWALERPFPLRAFFRKFSRGTCGSWLLRRWRLTTLLRVGCWYVVVASFYA